MQISIDFSIDFSIEFSIDSWMAILMMKKGLKAGEPLFFIMSRLHLWGDGWTAISGMMAGQPQSEWTAFLGWWLESHIDLFFLCGGWRAMCFVTVSWVVAGKP